MQIFSKYHVTEKAGLQNEVISKGSPVAENAGSSSLLKNVPREPIPLPTSITNEKENSGRIVDDQGPVDLSCDSIDSEAEAVNVVMQRQDISTLLHDQGDAGFIYAEQPAAKTDARVAWVVQVGRKMDDWVTTLHVVYLDVCGQVLPG